MRKLISLDNLFIISFKVTASTNVIYHLWPCRWVLPVAKEEVLLPAAGLQPQGDCSSPLLPPTGWLCRVIYQGCQGAQCLTCCGSDPKLTSPSGLLKLSAEMICWEHDLLVTTCHYNWTIEDSINCLLSLYHSGGRWRTKRLNEKLPLSQMNHIETMQ